MVERTFLLCTLCKQVQGLESKQWIGSYLFYQLCYAGKFCAKKWMMKYFKFSLLECMFICIKMHQLIAASFQAVELSCFKVKAKNSINHFCIGAGKKKPHLYELPSQINLDIFHFLSPNCVILFLNVKSFLCHMGCLMQVKGDIRITYKTAAHQHNMIAAAAVDHFQSGMRERCTLSAPDEVWLMSGWWMISC